MNKADKVIKVLTVLFLSIFFVALITFIIRFFRFETALDNLTYSQNFAPVDFIIYGSSQDSISGCFSILDSSGDVIVKIERAWQSEKIFLSFIKVNLKDGAVYYPYKIYGNRFLSKKSGIDLSLYYMSKGKCSIFASNTDKEQKEYLDTVARYALNSQFRSLFSNISIETLDLSVCNSGKEYIAGIDKRGELFIYALDE